MKSAYFQCVGGASGDMVLGSIVDAGVPFEEIQGAVDKLKIKGVSLSRQLSQRGGVVGTLVSVSIDRDLPPARRFEEFIETVERSDLPPHVIERSSQIFRRLARAEQMAHGPGTQPIRLHELGSYDTLVDVVGSVSGLELLSIQNLYSSPFPMGSGVIRSAHGVLPVPAPATAALFAMANAPIITPSVSSHDTGEMVTPTGAAIITTLASFSRPSMRLSRVGYGLGSRESQHHPNVLALWVGEEIGAAYMADLAMIETNIDDISGELLGYVQELLLRIGARDVWFTPIQMKKNRPATMLNVIIPSYLEQQTVELLMRETTTLGVRVRPVVRHEAERLSLEADTRLGRIPVKVKLLEGRSVAVSPEYEACRKVAIDKKMPLQEVYRIVKKDAEEKLLNDCPYPADLSAGSTA